MAFDYPVTLDVTGRRCVVVGGTALAESRARALAEAGADVVVIAEVVTPGLADLASGGAVIPGPSAGTSASRVTLVRRSYQTGDLSGAFVAVAAGDGRDPTENARLYAEADAAGVLLNAVDDNSHCHFALPSVLRRGGLAVTVSTGGRSPALAKRIRRDLDGHLGPEYVELVELIGEVRRDLLALRRAGDTSVPADFDTWAQRWERALAGDVAGLVRGGHIDEARALLVDTLTHEEAVA